ncbi:uncharacterized protein [Drosophila takahashii]|uniref:uncharacterized protein n=1 Tax=Drosophila takahashii TaxID=29030 RepID=UPI001CF80BEB|nr:uncharacterized protein LOC108060826 [Drosophila takahashii]
MNPFRPRLNANHRLNLERGTNIPGEMERRQERSVDGSVDDSVERQLRLTPRPVIRLVRDHQIDVERFVFNMNNLMDLQRENMRRGAGDGVYVWNMRPILNYNGQLGEGDNDHYGDFNLEVDQEELQGPDPLA